MVLLGRLTLLMLLVGLLVVLHATMVVHLTFPPAAVYHTGKLHCHSR
jgi:hypothetical protein